MDLKRRERLDKIITKEKSLTKKEMEALIRNAIKTYNDKKFWIEQLRQLRERDEFDTT